MKRVPASRAVGRSRARWYRPPDPLLDGLTLVAALGVGVVWPLQRGLTDWVTVAAVVLVSAGGAAAMTMVPERFSCWAILVGVACIFGYMAFPLGGLGSLPSLGGGLGLGVLTGHRIMYRRQEQRTTAHPPARFRLTFGDGRDELTMDNPTAADLDGVIAALDGGRRSILTVHRGDARLDVGGGPQGMVVFAGDEDGRWWQLSTLEQPPHPGRPDVEIPVTADRTRCATRRTTSCPRPSPPARPTPSCAPGGANRTSRGSPGPTSVRSATRPPSRPTTPDPTPTATRH